MTRYLHQRYLLILATTLSMFTTMLAQNPNGYYSKARNQKGKALKTALFQIISNHTQRSYKQLWEDFKSTDVRSDGKIWDMYSNVTNYEPGGSKQGANYSKEGDSYNREHSFPKSWFDDEYPMYTDLFHLYPTDGYVNNRRSNYPLAKIMAKFISQQIRSVNWESLRCPGIPAQYLNPQMNIRVILRVPIFTWPQHTRTRLLRGVRQC